MQARDRSTFVRLPRADTGAPPPRRRFFTFGDGSDTARPRPGRASSSRRAGVRHAMDHGTWPTTTVAPRSVTRHPTGAGPTSARAGGGRHEGRTDRDDRHRRAARPDRLRAARRRGRRARRLRAPSATRRVLPDARGPAGHARPTPSRRTASTWRASPGPSDWLIDRGGARHGQAGARARPTRTRRSSPASVRAPTSPRYLDGVSRDQIRDFELSPDRVLYRRIAGEAVPAAARRPVVLGRPGDDRREPTT